MRSNGKSVLESGPATPGSGGLRDGIAMMTDVCRRLAQGDFEARVPMVDSWPELAELRDAINRFSDIADAYVRESSAALAAASAGRYHRQFLPNGLGGAFAEGAITINDSRRTLRDAAEKIANDQEERAQLAETVYAVSTQVAAASTELGASARSLSESARSGVDETRSALETVKVLEASSNQIRDAATLIRHVADQTRMLAFNAAIEAARAGRAGAGFAVVASEVRSLADKTSTSSDQIAHQIDAAHHASKETVEAIARITATIEAIDDQVDGIAAAATGGLAGQGDGLSELAETLRVELDRLRSQS